MTTRRSSSSNMPTWTPAKCSTFFRDFPPSKSIRKRSLRRSPPAVPGPTDRTGRCTTLCSTHRAGLARRCIPYWQISLPSIWRPSEPACRTWPTRPASTRTSRSAEALESVGPALLRGARPGDNANERWCSIVRRLHRDSERVPEVRKNAPREDTAVSPGSRRRSPPASQEIDLSQS